MDRNSNAYGGAYHGAGILADAAGDDLGAQRVSADQAVRAVLLGGADGQDDAVGLFEVGFHLLPCLVLQ